VYLVFLDVPFAERSRRVQTRDGIGVHELEAIERHPAEVGVDQLEQVADLVLDGLLEPTELALELFSSLGMMNCRCLSVDI
jgi:hypothetical protein